MSDDDAAPVADDEGDAIPTKVSFVEMLTRDIRLTRLLSPPSLTTPPR
jgi:hypothetical protein